MKKQSAVKIVLYILYILRVHIPLSVFLNIHTHPPWFAKLWLAFSASSAWISGLPALK